MKKRVCANGARTDPTEHRSWASHDPAASSAPVPTGDRTGPGDSNKQLQQRIDELEGKVETAGAGAPALPPTPPQPPSRKAPPAVEHRRWADKRRG